MEIKVVENTEELVAFCDSWCAERVERTKAKLVFLPSGGTPTPLYKHWEAKRPAFLHKLEFTQLDEIITGPQRGVFAKYFQENFSSYWAQFSELKQQTKDPDIVVLGLGMNGHIAFHEPHVPKNFYKGEVELAEDTCNRLATPLGTRGLSYGAACFLKAKSILMIVRGREKNKIFEQFLNQKTEIPASLLRSHGDFTVVVDKDVLSAGQMQQLRSVTI